MISSNTRCTGTRCLQLHDILPLPLKQEGIHNDGCPRCIWCICGHSCTGSHCQYQLIIAYCNLFSCNGAVVLCMCWHVTIIVAITVIMIVKWHWHLDAFNGITMLIIASGVTLGISSCVTRTMQISGCTKLVTEISARSDISCMGNLTSLLLFFPTKANLWYKGWLLWWRWSQTWLSSCGALGCQDWWQSMLTRFVT